MSKLTAKSVIKDSFWIVEERGVKIGTLRFSDNQYVFYDNRTASFVQLENVDNFSFSAETQKSTTSASVHGYPTNTDIAYEIDLQDRVPIFKKTATSTVYFAAGYYGILFPMGWRPSYCPKLDTLDNYTYIGPFKNEADMHLAIKRKGQEHEGNTL